MEFCNKKLQIFFLGCGRAGDVALPSFLASMNSVGELAEAILSRITIADTNELAEAVESWRGASVDASLPCPMTRVVRRPVDNWDNMLREADQVSRTRLLVTVQTESGQCLAQCFAVLSLGTLLDTESFRVAIALRVGKWREDGQ